MFLWLGVQVGWWAGMRDVGGQGKAQPSLRGAGCWSHSLQQHPVAAQDGAESHKCNPQCPELSRPSLLCAQANDLRTHFLC